MWLMSHYAYLHGLCNRGYFDTGFGRGGTAEDTRRGYPYIPACG
jgi:hypothetical protein